MPDTFNNMFLTPADIILFVLAILVLLVFCGCIYAFFRAVFYFISSEGKEDKVKNAWNSIRYMVIGLFLTLMLLFAVPPLLKVFKLPGSEAFSTQGIFRKMGDIIKGIGEIGGLAMREYQKGNIDPMNPLGGSSSSSSSSSRNDNPTLYQL